MIALWACRIDLVAYAKALAFGNKEEKRLARAVLIQSDYYREEHCCHDVDAILQVEDEAMQFLMIKRKIESIPKYLRTQRMQAWVDASLHGMDVPKPCEETERHALRVLVDNFAGKVVDNTLRRSDLQLAAKVASGALQGSRVVSCLLQSFLDMQAKIAQGKNTKRLTSSKHLNEDTLSEIVFLLGKSTQSKAILRAFGVNDRKVDCRIDYEHPMLPAFYVACRDPVKC